MGKQARAKYDAMRKARLESDRRKGVNKFGLSRQPKAKPANYRAPVGFDVNSKGNAIVGSRIYRSPQVKGHDLASPILDDNIQVSDLFMPREPKPVEYVRGMREKAKAQPKPMAWLSKADQSATKMGKVELRRNKLSVALYGEPSHDRRTLSVPSGEPVADHGDTSHWGAHRMPDPQFGVPLVFVRREYRSAENGRTRSHYVNGPLEPISYQRIRYAECVGVLPPIERYQYDMRASERAQLQSSVDAWIGQQNAALADWLLASPSIEIDLALPTKRRKRSQSKRQRK